MRGSWLANTRTDEPRPEMGRPECPEWLGEEAKAIWGELVPQLDNMGVLAKIDRQELGEYCAVWGEWRKAYLWIQEHGMVYNLRSDPTPKQRKAGQKGDIRCVQQWPQVSIFKSLGIHLNKMAASFGMTPSARAGLTVGSKGKTKDKGKGRFFATG